MTILNFPAGPSEGAIYTVNGITYIYNDGAWTGTGSENINDIYVNVDGDNMTGDLTLGTDKIVLDAGNGNITADGSIFSGERDPSSSTASGTRIARDSRNGGVYVQSDLASENLMAFQALAGTNEKFKVTYDGAMTTAGEITTGVGITFPDGTTQILSLIHI